MIPSNFITPHLIKLGSPLGTQRFCDVLSTSLTLTMIQRRKNVVCLIGTDKIIVTRTF